MRMGSQIPMRLFLLACTALSCCLLAGVASAQVVVANSGVKSSAISKGDLYDIFTGASNTFPDGSTAVPVLLKGGPAHEAFSKNYIGKADGFLRTAWMRLLFAGKCTMPKTFDSDTEVLQYVASTPGAIGYVGAPPEDPHVKTVTIK